MKFWKQNRKSKKVNPNQTKLIIYNYQFSKFLSHQLIVRYVGNKKRLNPYIVCMIDKKLCHSFKLIKLLPFSEVILFQYNFIIFQLMRTI
jgi:hypothetical protein